MNKKKEQKKYSKKRKSTLKLKKRIFDIIQIGNDSDIPSRAFDVFISITIILNIVSMFMQTFPQLASFSKVFYWIDFVTICFFIVEYALRIWTSNFLYPEKTKVKAALRFLVSYDGVVDLLTILPFFYLSGFVVFRMLRVVRIFHLFRLNKNYDSFSVIKTVLWEKKNQLFSSIFIIVILMLASSLCMYHAEHEAQPDAFQNAFSAMWWSVATLLTVGYGDIYPVTTIGKVMGMFISFLGVGTVAIPTGIISAGFVEQYTIKQYASIKFHDIKRIGEVLVDSECPLKGLSVQEASYRYSSKIYLVIWGDLSLLADDDLIIQEKDIVIIDSPKLKKHQILKL